MQEDINTAITQYQQIHVRVICKNPYQTVGTLVAYLKMSGGRELKKFYGESPLRENVMEPFARARNNGYPQAQSTDSSVDNPQQMRYRGTLSIDNS